MRRCIPSPICRLFGARRSLVLLVADSLEPVNELPIELFLDRDVRHGGRGRGAVPVLLSRRAPDDIARSDDPDRTAPALHQATSGGDDQCLAEWMRMPVAARARLERHMGAASTCRSRRLEQRVDADCSGKEFRWPTSRWLGTVSLQVHEQILLQALL